MLTSSATNLRHKLTIGIIDCTVEKELCKRFNVRGYPTLKYYWDGEFRDYTFGRDEGSIVKFGERMSDSAVKILNSNEKVWQVLLGEGVHVAYVVYDPTTATDDDDDDQNSNSDKSDIELLQATQQTRTFNQVARKYQAHGSFGLLSPTIPSTTIASTLNVDIATLPTNGFIARIEEGVPTQFYTSDDDLMTVDALAEFITETNVPMVSELGGHNFRFVSRRGKPLVIGVYNPNDEVKSSTFRNELKQYAVGGTHSQDFVFSTMDGIKWDKFLSQFGITTEGLPEAFILDAPERTYWQDSSIFTVSEFIQAVKDGEIESRVQEKQSRNPLEEFSQKFMEYMPWSLFALLSLFVVVFWLALPSSEPLRPVVHDQVEEEETVREEEVVEKKDESKKDR